MLYYLKHRPLVFFFWTLIKNFQASIVEARVVQWWECFPPTPPTPPSPTTVNWVQILDLASHVDWVHCWFLSLLQVVFSGSSSFPLSVKYQHSKFQFNLAKVDKIFFCVLPSMHALLCLGPVTTYILLGEGIGGFLLYHTEINLVVPPPQKKKKRCSFLMTPFFGSQCFVAPPLYLDSYDCCSPLLPWKPCDPPFILSPPPPHDK